ncbi:4-hydroxy-tetrahydrodipicolinate synthase, partial [candidate division WOR-3 bacterium]|nr:4-hydroxy-tetrahydrodipicolinate synthase [candidate division WOR-3 bacterium]
LLITPFDKNLSLDEKGLRILVQRQIEAGIHGIAPLGVTGENTLLSYQEIIRVIEIIIKEVNGKTKVIPDTCTMSLEKTLERVKLFYDLGCDYAAVYVPYLILPTEEGIISFYKHVADESKIPIIMHNSPGRVLRNLSPEGTAKLAEHPNIIATKDGNCDMRHLSKVVYLTENNDFDVFTGKDVTAYPLLSFGGKGVFTVAGNVIPDVMKNITEYSLTGEIDKARELHYKYYNLFEALRMETNPMACKEALNLMRLPAGGLRLPLTRLSQPKREILKNVLNEKRLI